jgi:hypothetical protein
MNYHKNKNGIMNKFLKFFEIFDYFGVQMKFRINEKASYQSPFGGIMFIFFFIISFSYVGYNFFQFVNRLNMNLGYNTKNKTPAPPLNVRNSTFAFYLDIVGINDNNSISVNYITKRFNISTSIISFNATDDFNFQEFPMNFCAPEDVLMLDFTNILYDLSTSLCPQIPKEYDNFTIKGIITDNDYNYIEIKFTLKEEYQNRTLEIDSCLSRRKIYAVLSIIDTQIDYDNYTNPVSYFPRTIDARFDINTYKTISVSLSQLEFTSDDNILISNPLKKNYITYNSASLDINTVNDRKLNPEVLSFKLQVSPEVIILQRVYQKLPSFFADMSGILSQAILILLILIPYVNEKKAEQKIMNKVMRYKGNENFNADYFQFLFSNSDKKNSHSEANFNNQGSASNSVINQDNIDKSNAEPHHSRQSYKNVNLHLYDSIKMIKGRNKNRIKMNSGQILVSTFCCKKRFRIKTEIIERGEKKINHYLDVFTYLKKMQELDILKYLLLSKDELTVFNFLSKPSIYISNRKSAISIQTEEEITKSNDIWRIYESYKKINTNSEMNIPYLTLKLIEIFNSEVKNFN